MPRLKTPTDVPAGMRHCRCCQGVFASTEFNRDRHRPDGLRIYHRVCDVVKATAAKQRRKDFLAAVKRLTDPASVSPAERDAVNLAFHDALTETAEARTARFAATVAARSLSLPRPC